MRILITGGNGMLGQDLPPVLTPRHEVRGLGRADCDITDESAVRRILAEWKPELVINCASYTDVDGCERDPERAWAANAHGAGNVARAAAQAGARVFHISTDYVFDGRKRSPYTEQDPPHAISRYGQSKLAGEQQVQAASSDGSRYLILRTSWLYGLHRTNFVDTALARAQSEGRLEAVAEQVSCPTWTLQLAERLAELIETPAAGIIHVAGSGACSRYDMACYIASKVGPLVQVTPISWAQLKRPARRPLYSAMTSTRLEELGLHHLPHWKAALDEYLRLRQSTPVTG